jgi:hypothetical protein
MSKRKKVIVWQTIQCLKEKRHSLTENTMSKRKKVVVWQTIQKAWLEVESHRLTDNTMSKWKKVIVWQTIQCLIEKKSYFDR